MDRTRDASVPMVTHEAYQFRYRVLLDLCVLVQKEDVIRALIQRMRDPDVVCPTEAKILALLNNFHTFDRSCNRGTFVPRRIVDDYDVDGMVTAAQAIETLLQPWSTVVGDNDRKDFIHGKTYGFQASSAVRDL